MLIEPQRVIISHKELESSKGPSLQGLRFKISTGLYILIISTGLYILIISTGLYILIISTGLYILIIISTGLYILIIISTGLYILIIISTGLYILIKYLHFDNIPQGIRVLPPKDLVYKGLGLRYLLVS
ncbi:hypothetical protein TNCT_232901 [Trichonephila clavata]|uniref:Uncharacterized protein n=1 Tax=Trichonephila clavata TaxID=2740835 RepID=A0A8X6GGS3_TRICU|nr:hypothetical protein TNCT_232901 [Trichonephila clavata]